MTTIMRTPRVVKPAATNCLEYWLSSKSRNKMVLVIVQFDLVCHNGTEGHPCPQRGSSRTQTVRAVFASRRPDGRIGCLHSHRKVPLFR
jgi:hypothetical protein